jgi:type I restriction enzyme S subunit
MVGEWRSAPFAELCEHSAFGPRFGGELYATDGNVATLRTTDISADGRIDYDTMPLARLDLSRFQHHTLRTNDLVITRSGRIGTAALFNGFRLPVLPGAFLIRFRLKSDSAEPRFYRYFFNSPAGQGLLTSIATGSVQQNLNITSVHGLAVPVPPLSEQRAIADILSTLDDKIELNRRMNETLEAMARALFESWFVNFDPVRANAEGRDPGLPKPVADLFPDSFEDSELGEIPHGWGVRGLDEIARFLNGLALQRYPPKDGRSLPVIKIAQLRAGNTTGADAASADLDSDYIVEDGDVLFSWSGSLECVLWAGGIGALNQHLFKVTSTEFPKWFCYFWTHQHLADFRHIAAAKATTMGHIQRHHLSDAKVVVPCTKTLRAASDVFSPVVQRVIIARIESRILAALRDALLPKLISGELRIRARQTPDDEGTMTQPARKRNR